MAHLNPDSVENIIAFIRDGNSERVTMSDAMALAELMANSFETVFQSFDEVLHQEFREISAAISGMRTEIGRLQVNDMTTVRIPTAGRELDAIVEATEMATHAIMEAAETLLDADPSDDVEAYKATVDAQCMRIFEACSFQDITGQRVSKVIETLKHIEERVVHFSSAVGGEDISGPLSEDEAAREARKADLILHGPQLAGEGVNQAEIDDLLNDDADGASGNSQDDIDALFA